MDDRALATSGTYRNFFVEDGVSYSHFIDPRTGRPTKNSLASVSVVASTCMEADAAATASRQRAGKFEGLKGIPEGSFSEEDKLTFYNLVDDNAALQDGGIARSHDALAKLHTGQGLQPNEIKLLGRTYGPEFEKNLNKALKTNPLTKFKELGYEISIIPKAFLSAGSFRLRCTPPFPEKLKEHENAKKFFLSKSR